MMLSLSLCLAPMVLPAQQAPSPGGAPWREPSAEVVEILDAPPTPQASLSPDGRYLLLIERPAMPSLVDVMRPWVGLAGVRVDVAAGARHATSYDSGLVLSDLEGNGRRIELPEDARIGSLSWSHTGRLFAFTLLAEQGHDLWVADVETAEAKRVAGPLVAVFDSGYAWMPDGEQLWCSLVPRGRGAAPQRARVPAGPIVQETVGAKAPARTYQDLLADEYDAALFDHYTLAQLAVVDPATSAVVAVGVPVSYLASSVSPDGRHALVESLARPYSYTLPYWRFARKIAIWSLSGKEQAVVARLPLAVEVPLDGVPTGPRSVQWAASEPATVCWVEALDGGDPKAEAPFGDEGSERDRWLHWTAPFTAGGQVEFARVAQRARGISWLAGGAFVTSEYDRDRRWTTALLWRPGAEPQVIEDRSIRDGYGDPGRLVMRSNGQGQSVVRVDGPWAYRSAAGDAPEGARPFFSRTNLSSGETEVLWRAAPGSYESVVGVVQSGTERRPRLVTRYESPIDPPNYRLRDLDSNAVSPLTDYPHPAPSLLGIKKELVTYERADGVPLSATLYLPPGFDPDRDRQSAERLPLFVWAYPVEFNDASTAGQVSGSPYRYPELRGTSPLLLLTQGWAVMSDASMPVIGDPETVNDTFVEQIVSAAEAAIQCAAERGVADPERAAVGGHSYGAFMTANLLAHSDLFKAGVARSGAYNRTLTPFGFQSERRTVWEAPELYFAISPFLHADKINEPLLLIHGERDNNSGTFPMQSDRLYSAIQGNGGTVRYVKLPGESHGYRARESVLHVTAETFDWLDEHVAQAPTGSPAQSVEAGSPAEAQPDSDG